MNKTNRNKIHKLLKTMEILNSDIDCYISRNNVDYMKVFLFQCQVGVLYDIIYDLYELKGIEFTLKHQNCENNIKEIYQSIT